MSNNYEMLQLLLLLLFTCTCWSVVLFRRNNELVMKLFGRANTHKVHKGQQIIVLKTWKSKEKKRTKEKIKRCILCGAILIGWFEIRSLDFTNHFPNCSPFIGALVSLLYSFSIGCCISILWCETSCWINSMDVVMGSGENCIRYDVPSDFWNW